MRSPALWKIAQKLARENMQLKAGERVCVVSDLEKLGLAEVFLDAAAAFDTDPVLVLMTPRDQHGQEVPEVVAAAMEGADVVFQVVTHAMTHTDATKRALAAGARILVLRGVTEDMMLHGAINADYQQIAVRCARLSEKMNGASLAHVRTALGTDLAMSLEGRQSLVLDGIIKGPGRFIAMPDGETAIVPLEGSAQGILVVEHTMDGVGPGSFGRVVAGERDRIVKPALGSVVAAAEELHVPQFAVCLGGERVVVDAARSLDRL